MTKIKGKFIVLYGVNNLGKTTQATMLVDRLNKNGQTAEYIKYPIYSLSPSGKLLNSYLRENNPHNLSPREAQILYTTNRTQFEKTLLAKLESGINVIAEDYTGTGIAWGISTGTNEGFLKYLNSYLIKEDMAFLFNGKRFKEAKEVNHKHESNDFLMDEVRWTHLKLGKEYRWIVINANSTISKIHQQLWDKVSKIIPSVLKDDADHQEKNILKVELINKGARLPTRSHKEDAGLDLYSTDNYSVIPGKIDFISTGIKVAIPLGQVGLIWDKSGLASQGIKTMGGVIDAGYRGEIKVVIKNLSFNIINIQRGQKIAQLLIQKIKTPKIIESKISNNTKRGTDGFGSTGIF